MITGPVYGVEAQFFTNEEFVMGRTFNPRLDLSRTSREMAVLEMERLVIEGDVPGLLQRLQEIREQLGNEDRPTT